MKKSTLFATALLALATFAQAAPTEINYQGVLTDQNGNPVNGVRAMQIKIYDAPTGGTLLYSEDLGNVPVQDGIYAFNFGANGTSGIGGSSIGVSSALFSSSQPWAEVLINGVAQIPRQKLLAVPYALTSKNTEDTEVLFNLILHLQNQISQGTAQKSAGAPISNLISDAFFDPDGVNNLVNTNSTTAAHGLSGYNAGAVSSEPTTYSVFTNWASFLKLKTYSDVNASLVQVAAELQLDTQCYVIFKYQDGTSAQTATQNGSGNSTWVKRIFANPQLSKQVSSFEVWGSKPSSLGGNTTQLKNIEILRYQNVEIVIDLSNFGREIKAAQLLINGSRQNGDSISYTITNGAVSNSGLPLGVKSQLTHTVSQPAKLIITLSPAQIENFVFGGTSIRAFSIILW